MTQTSQEERAGATAPREHSGGQPRPRPAAAHTEAAAVHGTEPGTVAGDGPAGVDAASGAVATGDAQAPPGAASGAVAPGSGRTREAIRAALTRTLHPARVNPLVAGPGVAVWAAFALVSAFVPDNPGLPLKDAGLMSQGNGWAVAAALAVAAVWAVVWALSALPGRVGRVLVPRVAFAQKWVLGAGVWFLFWVFSTAKTLFFAPPYLVAPQEILAELWNSRGILAASLGNSLLLLAVGFAVGLVAGLATGITIGWFQLADYWVHPILVFIGPVPALAWVPIVFVLFPSSYSGAVFMIALSVWFPISVLTRAGVLAVPRTYYDVAQTLGAKRAFLVFRVAVPAALPDVFTGAFMALGSSFVSLTVAENFGVNSGLGWFLNWKKSWGDFPGVYAGIIVLIVVCGALLTLLNRTRGWVLRWEKEITRW